MKIELIYSTEGGWLNILIENQAEALALQTMKDKKLMFSTPSDRNSFPYPQSVGLHPVNLKNNDKAIK